MHPGLPQARGPGRRDSAGQNACHDGHGHAVGEAMKGKEYVRPIPNTWWLAKRSYTLFMLREITSFFVAGYAVFLLVLLFKASQGIEEFEFFLSGFSSPLYIGLHIVALVMVLYHTITFFNLAGAVMRIFRGE